MNAKYEAVNSSVDKLLLTNNKMSLILTIISSVLLSARLSVYLST